MKNNIFTRLLSLLLAIMCLVSGAVTVVGAEGAADNLTDKSIADYKETLNTISYKDYQALYFANAAVAQKELAFALTDNWSYESDNIRITVQNGDWKMIVLGKAYDSAEAAAEDGCTQPLYTVPASGSVRVITETYEELADALAAKDEKGNAKYSKEDLAYVTEDYEGVKAVYTPGRGKTVWELDFKEQGIDKATLFSIGLLYYPVVAKSTSIEREFLINGQVPFSESRSLTLSKVWSTYQQGSVSDGNKTNLIELCYTHYLGGKNLQEFLAEAKAAGFAEGSYVVSKDQSAVTFTKPKVITPKMSAFIQNYGLRFLSTDINRNEILPTQVQTPRWLEYVLSDSDGFTHSYVSESANGETVTYNSEYFGFVVTPDGQGKVSITLNGVNEPMALSEIAFKPYKSAYSYDDYYKNVSDAVGTAQGSGVIKIEAENTTNTSTNVVYPVEDRTSPLTSPCDTGRTLLNTIGTSKWATAGQWVEYSFSVDTPGWYDIYARFKQSYLDGMYVSRSMQIFTFDQSFVQYDEASYLAKFGKAAGYYNGLPFAEAAGWRFDYSTDWQVTKLTDGNDPYQIYFQKGVIYTIRLEVTLGTMSDQVRKIESVLELLNSCYLDIIQLTGTSPDDYRDYSFYRMLPKTMENMIVGKNTLKEISDMLRNTAGVASTYTGVCDKLVDLLERMVSDGGEPIAKNLDTFKSYVGSLGTFLTDAKTQPLQLDYITIQPSTEGAPAASANFFQSLWHEIMSFIQSFFRDYNSMGATEQSTSNVDSITVWVPYGRDQANVIRNLSTNGFTQDYGVAVDLKLVAGGTLLPSILAGIGPDVYLGLDQASVINYAIRGALAELEEMDGCLEIMDEETSPIFNAAAITVLKIADADGDEHYYGLPETQGFSMMFVRLDILADLDIEIPQTWDDLYNAQTILQSNNMMIGVTTDYKYFLYQMGGDLWADGGMRINLDSEVGLSAFNKMCDMFTQYSFPYSYDAANRFRTGEMPIILSSYTALYNQLKVFATELDGCWAFVPVPGIKQADGTINNDSISAVSAVVMIEASQNKESAWKYMRWYTGAECQEDYANEMVAIIGDSAKHDTANREALISMPWTYDEYLEVSKQFENLASVNNYPGYYYIDRYTNFAFLSAYNEGADPSTEILSYINVINNEITRKRQEFGLETLELGQKLSEKRFGQASTAMQALQQKYNANGKYTDVIDLAKYGIANEKIVQLREAAEELDDLLAQSWDKKTKDALKVNGETIKVPTYYNNIGKQTMEEKSDGSGGYSIDSLDELQLVFFISEALKDAADALASY